MTWDQVTVSYCFSSQKGTTAKAEGGKKKGGKTYLYLDTHSGNRGEKSVTLADCFLNPA